MRLQDQVALVTGGSRGIGRAIVKAFAAEGAKVAFVYHSNREAAEKLVGEADIERGVARAGGPPPATKETTKIAKARAVRRALVQGAVDLGLAPDAAGAGIVDGERSLAALRLSRARTSASDAASRSGVKAK